MLGRIYLTGDDGYQILLVFASMASFLKLDSNRIVTNWMFTGISSIKIKPFDTGYESTMSNLAKNRVHLKFNNSALEQKSFSSPYSNFILNLYIAY